jgi:hypothetical protein
MVAPDPWMDIQGHELLPHTQEKSSVRHYNQDFHLNLLPCWLGFVDGVDVPLLRSFCQSCGLQTLFFFFFLIQLRFRRLSKLFNPW